MTESKRKYDIAYGSFAFVGVTSLIVGLLSFVPMDTATAGGLGFLVLIPLSIISLAAILVGFVYTIILFRHRRLIILSLLSILFLIEAVAEYGSPLFYSFVPLLYGLIVCAFSFAWFFVRRKRFGTDVS
jgi:hypothetical protein